MDHRKDELKERNERRTRDEGKHQERRDGGKVRGQEKDEKKERMKILKRLTAH